MLVLAWNDGRVGPGKVPQTWTIVATSCSPPARIARAVRSFASVQTVGLPPTLPRARAAARPASPDEVPLALGKSTQDVEHQAPAGSARVDALGQVHEGDAPVLEVGDGRRSDCLTPTRLTTMTCRSEPRTRAGAYLLRRTMRRGAAPSTRQSAAAPRGRAGPRRRPAARSLDARHSPAQPWAVVPSRCSSVGLLHTLPTEHNTATVLCMQSHGYSGGTQSHEHSGGSHNGRKPDWKWAVGILVALLAIYVTVALAKDWWPFSPKPKTSEVVIDSPKGGETVSYPEPVEGRIVGRAPASDEELWAGERGGNGRYYTQSIKCAVQATQNFECPKIYLGVPKERDVQHTLCVLLVEDSTQFRNYAKRPDPAKSFPGFELDRDPVIVEDCVQVRR